MRRAIIGLAMAVLIAAMGIAAAHAQSTAKLEGAWIVVSADREGKKADDLKGHRLTFDANTFRVELEGRLLFKGTFTIDPAARPARVDFHHTEGELTGTRWLGVYRLRGDTLRIADNAVNPSRPRPTQLACTPGSGCVLLSFKRATP